jgi:hypothetical protein
LDPSSTPRTTRSAFVWVDNSAFLEAKPAIVTTFLGCVNTLGAKNPSIWLIFEHLLQILGGCTQANARYGPN